MRTRVEYSQLKVGDLVARDLDSFMLGNRWLVAEIASEGAMCVHWWCGIKDKWATNNWLISPTEEYIWTDTSETLDTWKNKQFNISKDVRDGWERNNS
jgi:hypothetical protein